MNEIIEKEIKIENMIYEIRGKQVMLDSDLAKLYQCANGTKTINLAVKRNIDRFPADFYFQLTNEEYSNLRFQFETANLNAMSRSLPYVFTEQGVAMLASVLRTNIASLVSVDIMRAFVKMKKYISNELLEQQYMKDMLIKHDDKIEKYNKQYNNLTIKHDETFHDRYFILDKNIVYHCGTSVNQIGRKTFSINILQEKEIINLLIKKVGNI